MLVDSAVEVDVDTETADTSYSMDALAAQAAQTVIADSGPNPISIDNGSVTLPSPRGTSSSRPELENNGAVYSGDPNIDFSSAPSDPIELAWWVAQQITHFQPDGYAASDLALDDGQQTTASPPQGLGTRPSNGGLPSRETAEREKLREENRERKKRWRESNTERSTQIHIGSLLHSFVETTKTISFSDKDNDLRCRINKRAKTKFGPGPSVEKTAYVETEFNKRRNKRERKQRARALETGEYPSFAVAPELTDHLFSAHNPSASGAVQVAGNLLMKTLFGANGSPNLTIKAEASNALKLALENGSLDPRPFIEALRIMARNADLMRGINARLNYDREEDEGEGISGDDNGRQSMQSAGLCAESASSEGSMLNHQSTERIKAINAVTALLNEMADTKAYASPYGNPPPPVTKMNGYGVHKSNGVSQSTSSNETTNGHGLDQSQIDALLALANGGSLTDDEDDKTIADPDEFSAQQLDLSDMTEADGDINATLQRIISQLMAERGVDTSKDRRGNHFNMSRSDPYGNQSIRDQAALLQSLFAQAGVSINTVIPREQGQATSQLYAHLSSRARSTTPAKGINPVQARSYGSPAQMHQKILASPNVLAQANNSNQHPLQAITSRANVIGLPTRARNPEELRKIKSYGYPPLPGQKVGMRRQ